MPQLNAAKKALRKSTRQRAVNDRWRVAVRDSLRTVKNALAENNKQAAEKAYGTVQKTLDRAARRNVIHPNQAARKKSRLQRAIQKLS